MSHGPEWPQANAVPALCSPTSKPTSHTAERKSIEAPDSRPQRLCRLSLNFVQEQDQQDQQRIPQDVFLPPELILCLNLTLGLSHPYLSDEDNEAQGTWTNCDVACGRIRTGITLTLYAPFVLSICILSLAVLINRAIF